MHLSCRAWETAQSLQLNPPSTRLLKLSGIGIALAGVLEDRRKISDAYDIYSTTFDLLQQTGNTNADAVGGTSDGLSPKERLRTVGLAMKLGELSRKMGLEEKEERWLNLGLEELLRLLSGKRRSPKLTGQNAGPVEDDGNAEIENALKDLALPDWVSNSDLGGVMERVGEFYARKGNAELSRTISILHMAFPLTRLLPDTRSHCTFKPWMR